MKAKKDKEPSALPSFEPYLINLDDGHSLKTFQQVLTRIFSKPQKNTQDSDLSQKKSTLLEEVNEIYLIRLAHGIQGASQYDPEKTPEEIKKWLILHLKKSNFRTHACLFFLHHFEASTCYHLNPSSQRNLERISPRNAAHLIPFCPTKTSDTKHSINLIISKKDKQIEAMAHDIKLFNFNNFMRIYSEYILLGKPVPLVNQVTSGFNQLYKLIVTDLVSSRDDQKALQKKMKIYLAVANKLLLDESIIDFEGAGIISYVLSIKDKFLENTKNNISLKNEIAELFKTFNPNGNYKMLREKMNSSTCIPLFLVISKDLVFADENPYLINKIFIFGKLYHDLYLKILALQEETRKQRIFHPAWQTNLCGILNGSSLFKSSVPCDQSSLDDLPTITCKAFILSKNKISFWDKINNIYEEQSITETDFKGLSLKLNMESQPTDSARLLTLPEIKIIQSMMEVSKKIPLEINHLPRQKTPSSPRHASKSLRHSVAITPISKSPVPKLSLDKVNTKPQVQSIPVISHSHQNWARETLSLAPIQEDTHRKETSSIDKKRYNEGYLRNSLIEHSYFPRPGLKRSQRLSEPSPMKSSAEDSNQLDDSTLVKK